MPDHLRPAGRGSAGEGSPPGGSSPAAVTPATPALDRAGERLAYLDNLKAFLIAGIIAAHAFMGYSTWGSWTYQDIQEVTISEVTETIFVVASVALGGMFLMGLFFLLSGLMTQDSLARKGPRRFVSDRLLRLGIPFALYTLAIWPVLEWALLEPFLPRWLLLGLVHRRRPHPGQRPDVVRPGCCSCSPWRWWPGAASGRRPRRQAGRSARATWPRPPWRSAQRPSWSASPSPSTPTSRSTPTSGPGRSTSPSSASG